MDKTRIIRATKRHAEICMKYVEGKINFTQAKFLLIYECKMSEDDAIYLLDEFEKDFSLSKQALGSVAIFILILFTMSMLSSLLIILW